MIYRQILPLLQQHQTDQLLVLPFHLVDHTWDSKDKKKKQDYGLPNGCKEDTLFF